eukprot:TRINITY_DN9154_c0_g1_i2.p1 TRINITY_DN9154_c0_g1~~TRINITY_DN9154_c0_g1_i2.p1  ORF type:complete len:986 (+),score=134.30 TRINITY_DN9154_c0_g1_i2:77-3034(+)
MPYLLPPAARPEAPGHCNLSPGCPGQCLETRWEPVRTTPVRRVSAPVSPGGSPNTLVGVVVASGGAGSCSNAGCVAPSPRLTPRVLPPELLPLPWPCGQRGNWGVRTLTTTSVPSAPQQGTRTLATSVPSAPQQIPASTIPYPLTEAVTLPSPSTTSVHSKVSSGGTQSWVSADSPSRMSRCGLEHGQTARPCRRPASCQGSDLVVGRTCLESTEDLRLRLNDTREWILGVERTVRDLQDKLLEHLSTHKAEIDDSIASVKLSFEKGIADLRDQQLRSAAGNEKLASVETGRVLPRPRSISIEARPRHRRSLFSELGATGATPMPRRVGTNGGNELYSPGTGVSLSSVAHVQRKMHSVGGVCGTNREAGTHREARCRENSPFQGESTWISRFSGTRCATPQPRRCGWVSESLSSTVASTARASSIDDRKINTGMALNTDTNHCASSSSLFTPTLSAAGHASTRTPATEAGLHSGGFGGISSGNGTDGGGSSAASPSQHMPKPAVSPRPPSPAVKPLTQDELHRFLGEGEARMTTELASQVRRAQQEITNLVNAKLVDFGKDMESVKRDIAQLKDGFALAPTLGSVGSSAVWPTATVFDAPAAFPMSPCKTAASSSVAPVPSPTVGKADVEASFMQATARPLPDSPALVSEGEAAPLSLPPLDLDAGAADSAGATAGGAAADVCCGCSQPGVDLVAARRGLRPIRLRRKQRKQREPECWSKKRKKVSKKADGSVAECGSGGASRASSKCSNKSDVVADAHLEAAAAMSTASDTSLTAGDSGARQTSDDSVGDRERADSAASAASQTVPEAADVPRPHVGDEVMLVGPGIPHDYRSRPAVVTKVAEAHCTAVVLDDARQCGHGECWPSFHDVQLDRERCWRLGSRVVLSSLTGRDTRRLNGLQGEIVEHPREGHPCFIRKPSAPESAVLTICVRLDDPGSAGHQVVLMKPRFLELYDIYVEHLSARLEDAIKPIADRATQSDQAMPH